MSNLERLITILRGEKRDEQNMVFMTSKDISQRHIMPDTDFELMKYCGLICSNAEYNWVTFDNLEDEIYHEICAYQDDINVQVDDRTVEYLLKYAHIAKGVGFGKRK